DVTQPHLRSRLRETKRLERVRRMLGPARVDIAVAAGASAGVAEDLERRRPPAPALGDVRTARLLADRVQPLAVDQRAHLEVAGGRARGANLHPLRPARPVGDGQRALHRGQSTQRRGGGYRGPAAIASAASRAMIKRVPCGGGSLNCHVYSTPLWTNQSDAGAHEAPQLMSWKTAGSPFASRRFDRSGRRPPRFPSNDATKQAVAKPQFGAAESSRSQPVRVAPPVG